MSKKKDGLVVTRQAVRKLQGRQNSVKPCTTEMMNFLNCVAGQSFDARKCKEEVNLLSQCTTDAEEAKKTHRDTTMYHILRLSKQL